MTRRSLEVHDDRPHEHGGEDGWKEHLGFTFSDPAIIGSVRMSWEPIERKAEADLVIRLEDGVLARATARENEVKVREDSIGAFKVACPEQMRVWTLEFNLKGMLLASLNDASMMGRSVPVTGTLEFVALADADGSAARRRIITAQRFASIISSGSFAQPMKVTGSLRIGDRRMKLDGNGIRTRSWGIREADPSDAQVLIAFDDEHAIWFEKRLLGDTEVDLAGSMGAIKVPSDLEVQRGEDGRATKLILGGTSAEVVGHIPAEGSNDERLILRCRSGALEGLGIGELALQDPAEEPATQGDHVVSPEDESVPDADRSTDVEEQTDAVSEPEPASD